MHACQDQLAHFRVEKAVYSFPCTMHLFELMLDKSTAEQ
jgi:hypothetical protein